MQQKQPNLHYAGLHVQVGRLTAEDLQDLAKVSEQYGGAEIRLTEDQNIILVGIKQSLLEDLKQIAIPRHSGWDALGLMSTRIFVKKRLSEYGAVEENFFKEGSDEGVNCILKLPGKNSKLGFLS